MRTKRLGRPRIGGDIEAEIKRLSYLGWTPAQIHQELKRRPQFEGRYPVARTVRRIVAGLMPQDTSGWWSLADADGDDAAAILPVLAGVIERTTGRISRLTKAQAACVLKIRHIAPDLSPWWAFRLAISYRVRVHREQPTADLDELLAFAPWRGREHFDRFFRVVKLVHPDWTQSTGHEPAEDASPEEMRAALGSLSIAEGLWLAMEMQKGDGNGKA